MTLTKEQAMFTSDTAKYKIIGICTSCVQSDYVREIVSSISRKGVKEGYKVLLFNTFCDLYHNSSYNHGEASIFDLINYDILDVLIIMPEAIKRDSISNEISKRAHEHGVPVICVDSTMDNCCSVTFNYSNVFEKIVRHVIEFHGCRRVNFIAGVKGNAFSEERIEAYKKVLAENGIEFELYHRMNNSDGHEQHMFSYLAKTVECHTVEEMAKVMARSGDYYSWVCTNSDFLSNTRQRERFNNSFTKQMRVFMQTFDNKYKTGEVFDTKDLLPDMEQVLGRHNCLMFSPLHFQDEVIGYAANSYNPIYFLFQNTRRFINNTNQIMESFKNRQRLERANAELARIHMLDPMTGIYNRRGFYKNVRKLISKAEKQGVGVWVFSIDMDNLKKINDLYGHNEGDKAIKAVASLMTKCTVDGGICSRFGGDEFVAVIAETDGADSFYEKVSRSIAEYNRRSKSPYDVSISCGYKAGKPKTLKEIDDLMKASDREMYTQKRKHHSRRD